MDTMMELNLQSVTLSGGRLRVRGWNWSAAVNVILDDADGSLMGTGSPVIIRDDVNRFVAWVSGAVDRAAQAR